MYEVHIYEDNSYEIYNTLIGSGHGEKIIYIVRDTDNGMEPFIAFKYVSHSSIASNKYLKFNIQLCDFLNCKLPYSHLFDATKNIYLKDKSFVACTPTVYAHNIYELARLGKVDTTINDILKSLDFAV